MIARPGVAARVSSLRLRNVRLFLVGQLVSSIGTWMHQVAEVWLMLQVTDSGLAVGLVVAARFLLVLVLGLWCGALADRYDRRSILYVTQSVRGVAALTLGALTFADAASAPVILVLAFVGGAANAIDNPVRRAFLRELVDDERVLNAVSLNSTVMATRLCGLVYCAPNDKRTVPWQVAVFIGPARAELGELLCADLVTAVPDVPEAKVEKTRSKYLRAPAIVVVGWRPDADPIRHRENLAAVAAGLQNLLLGASAAGLAALWSSPPAIDAAETCARAGFEPGALAPGLSANQRFPQARFATSDNFGLWKSQRRSSRNRKRSRTSATRSGSIVASSVVSSPAAVVSSSPSGSTTRLSPA